MKFQFLILGAIVFVASCNTQPQAGNNRSSDSTKSNADTTGLAEFQAMKAQNELGAKNEEEHQNGKSTSKSVNNTTHSSTHTTATNGSSTSSNSGSTSSTGTPEKKGWSKTAKGAVIGGVVGAGTGAVVNKKNRAAGAVVGGVLGAGAGAVIGNKMDKKDGRH